MKSEEQRYIQQRVEQWKSEWRLQCDSVQPAQSETVAVPDVAAPSPIDKESVAPAPAPFVPHYWNTPDMNL
jgi:hypothetical protein